MRTCSERHNDLNCWPDIMSCQCPNNKFLHIGSLRHSALDQQRPPKQHSGAAGPRHLKKGNPRLQHVFMVHEPNLHGIRTHFCQQQCLTDGRCMHTSRKNFAAKSLGFSGASTTKLQAIKTGEMVLSCCSIKWHQHPADLMNQLAVQSRT